MSSGDVILDLGWKMSLSADAEEFMARLSQIAASGRPSSAREILAERGRATVAVPTTAVLLKMMLSLLDRFGSLAAVALVAAEREGLDDFVVRLDAALMTGESWMATQVLPLVRSVLR